MVARVPYPGLDETTNTIDRSGFADDIVMPFEDDLSAQIGLDVLVKHAIDDTRHPKSV